MKVRRRTHEPKTSIDETFFDEGLAQMAVDLMTGLKEGRRLSPPTTKFSISIPSEWQPWQIDLVRKIFGTVDKDGNAPFRSELSIFLKQLSLVDKYIRSDKPDHYK